MDKHLTAVAALQIGMSIFGLFFVALIFILLTSLGMIIDDPEAVYILWAILPGIGFFIGLLSVLGIVGGIGLFGRRHWARILILIVSAIDLLNFPIGTALAIYSIWVLVQPEMTELLN